MCSWVDADGAWMQRSGRVQSTIGVDFEEGQSNLLFRDFDDDPENPWHDWSDSVSCGLIAAG